MEVLYGWLHKSVHHATRSFRSSDRFLPMQTVLPCEIAKISGKFCIAEAGKDACHMMAKQTHENPGPAIRFKGIALLDGITDPKQRTTWPTASRHSPACYDCQAPDRLTAAPYKYIDAPGLFPGLIEGLRWPSRLMASFRLGDG